MEKNYFDKKKDSEKPKLLVANTIKGKGFSFTENNNDWHHAIVTEKLYNELEPYGLLQFVRSGRISVSKEPMNISNILGLNSDK